MMGAMVYRYALAAAAVAALAACSSSSSGKGANLPSSSGQSAYALKYGDQLGASTKTIGDAQSREKTLSGGFAAHVDELKKPDWSKVEVIIDDSDRAGKSADFADGASEASAVKSFWDAEKDNISGRVAGAAKQGGCPGEANGAVVFAMNDGVQKQLQKRLRGRNEAFVVIERYKTSLGPQNTQSLEKLADEISEASYDVHVLMPTERDRLRRLATDKEDVKKTLDRYVEEENAFQAEPGRSDADKKASAERVNAANKAKANVDSAAAQAEQVSKDADTAIDAAKKDYDEALKNLKAKVAEKKKAEPKPEKS
jgi:hypothetical protein